MAKLTSKPKSPALVRIAGSTLVATSLMVGACGDDTTAADAATDTTTSDTSDDAFVVGVTDAGISAPDASGDDAPPPGISAPDAGDDAMVEGVSAPDAGDDAGR